MQKDNSTFERKRALRLSMLQRIADPVIMETHGGIGKLFAYCYASRPRGVVFEKDPAKADFLATQRPTWSVYCSDVLPALRAGAGAHLPINFIDLDPYGSPWEVLDAFLTSSRVFPPIIALVVNDGLRQSAQIGGAWNVHALRSTVAKYGNHAVYRRYKEICREILTEKAQPLGYSISHWVAYYTGSANSMTHWAALLNRETTLDPPSTSSKENG